jgi:hypothetical protein
MPVARCDCQSAWGYGRFAVRHDELQAAHGGGRIHRHDLADHEPIDQVTRIAASRCSVGTATLRVCALIQVATWRGATWPSEAKPALVAEICISAATEAS